MAEVVASNGNGKKKTSMKKMHNFWVGSIIFYMVIYERYILVFKLMYFKHVGKWKIKCCNDVMRICNHTLIPIRLSMFVASSCKNCRIDFDETLR